MAFVNNVGTAVGVVKGIALLSLATWIEVGVGVVAVGETISGRNA